MKNLKTFKTFLFDLDDTIFLSEERNIGYIFKYFKSLNITLDEEDKNIVFGHSWQHIYKHIINKYKLDKGINEVNEGILKLKFQDIVENPLIHNPGIKTFLKLLEKKKRKKAIVTGSCYKEALFMLKSKNMHFFFFNKKYLFWRKKYLIFAAEDYKESKPSPKGFFLALKILKSKPQETLVFEDSKSGIIGAKKAGCKVAFIKNFSNLSLSDLKGIKSYIDYIFNDFKEVLALI